MKIGRAATFFGVLFVLLMNPGFTQEPYYWALDQAAMEIRKKKIVSEVLLARDREVITAAYPAIRRNYQRKGLGEADANDAVATAWKYFRLDIGTVQTAFTEDSFRAYVSRLGKLRIESEPTAAEIQINSILIDATTNTSTWLEPGNYRIVLTKTGYIAEEARVTIVEGSNPKLKRTLRHR